MSRNRLMSEALRTEIARKLGVDGQVGDGGWGSVSSRDCGRMVRTAIEIAENSIR